MTLQPISFEINALSRDFGAIFSFGFMGAAILSSSAWAQTLPEAANSPTPTASEAPEPTMGKSAAARQNKPFSVLAGVGFMPRVGEFFSITYAPNSSIVLEPFFERGFYSFGGALSVRVRAGARAVFFPGNSFYVSGGANFESFTKKDDEHYYYESRSIQASYNGVHNQLEVELGLGNRWQFDSGFTVGATWFGVSRGVVPLGTKMQGKNLSEKELSYLKSRLKDDATFPSFHFAKLLVGWSF